MTVNAYTVEAAGTRVIDNSGTFTLGKNVTIENGNANGSAWGGILINRKGESHLYGSMKNNTTVAASGPILQLEAAGKVYIYDGVYSGNIADRAASNPSVGGVIHIKAGTVVINGGTFENNTSSGDGGVAYVAAGAVLTVNGGTFKGNTANRDGSALYVAGDAVIGGAVFEGGNQTVCAEGTVGFNNVNGAVFVQKENGVIKAIGTGNADTVTVTPYSYTAGNTVLVKGEEMSEADFAAVCESVAVTQLSNTELLWSIDGNGKLIQLDVAYIGDTYYKTLHEAVQAANASTEPVTIYLIRDAVVSTQLTIRNNVTICNEQGKDITIIRGGNNVVFNVSAGNSLTLGTNDENETGTLTVNAYTEAVANTRVIENFSTFTLGANATIKNIHSNQWGCAIINRNTATAELYGNITDNICTGDGGAILQHGNGKTTIYSGEYKNNHSTKIGGGKGAVVRVYGGTLEIKGGSFEGNVTEYCGGVVYVDEKKSAVISGGTFKGNTANESGNALYVAGTVQINGGSFENDQTIYVAGTVNGDSVPQDLIRPEKSEE